VESLEDKNKRDAVVPRPFVAHTLPQVLAKFNSMRP
jgi:hypothetical protein